MRQAGRYRGAGKPIIASALRARVLGRDPIPRKALWPAAHVRRVNRSNTWPHRPVSQNIQFPLAKGGPSTHGESAACRVASKMTALDRNSDAARRVAEDGS